MFIAVLALIIAILLPAARGRLLVLAQLRLRGAGFVGGALAVQIVIISVIPNAPQMLSAPLHVGTYLAAAVFLWLNRNVPWMWVVSIGGLSNLAVIAANRGVMPASEGALHAAQQEMNRGFNNSAPVPNAHLAFLGDVFASPQWLPLSNVFSIGDVVLVAGLILVITAATRRTPEPSQRTPLNPPPLTRVDRPDETPYGLGVIDFTHPDLPSGGA
jgi:hypothetical protein